MEYIGLYISAGGLFIALIFNIYAIIRQTDETRLKLFSIYTQRYFDIIKFLPNEVFNQDYDIHSLDSKERNEIIKGIRLYCDLCSEEYDLWLDKKIEKRIWNNWKAGIKYCFSKKAFRYSYNEIVKTSDYYPDFKDFMDKEILNGEI